MKKLIFCSILLISTFNFCLAQYQISGKLIDAKNEPLGFANIVLSLSTDSSFVGGTTSDVEGEFLLSIDHPDIYSVAISMLGFKTSYVALINLNVSNPVRDLGVITLSEGGLELGEINVVAEKPIFEQRIDRTVINLDNRIATAGASALEVLEQSPGVVINRSSGAIGMLGKDGVNVMINGKMNYMPNDALLQFLEGMDANNILKIELITTPPANLDAQGNAGFINIVLKRNTEEGWKGSYALTGGYGRGVLGNGSINVNYRKGKFNLFGNYAYTRNDQEQSSTMKRIFGEVQTDLITEREPSQNNQNARLGLDYQITNQTTVGVLLSGYLNKWDMDAVNTIEERGIVDTRLLSLNTENNDWQHLQGNLNLSHQFSNAGKLSIDFDYLGYKNENPTNYDQSFQDFDGNELSREKLFSTKTTPFDIQVGKVDYTLPISDQLNFEIGGKYVQSNFENNVLVEENDVVLSNFTSESDLQEHIIAAYSSVDYQLSEKIQLKGGLRYEHTSTELNSSNDGKVIDRQFGRFFPSVYFNYKISPTQQFNISYSKRINRPSFSDMAPFIIFLSPNTSYGGNEALQPAIANTFQINYRLKTVNFSIQYTQEDSTIVRYQNRFDPNTNTQLIVPNNLSEQNTFSAFVAFPIKIKEWWNIRLFGIYNRQSITLIDEEFGVQEFQQNSFRWNGSQSFKLPNDFSIELSGFYQSASLFGNVKFQPQGVFNFGIQKKLKNQARLTFNINDVFNALKAVGITDLPEENIFVDRAFDFSQRTFKLTYATTFGNQKVKNNRNRNSSKEERNRVN